MVKLSNPQIGTIVNAIKKFYSNADTENIGGMRIFVIPKFVVYDLEYQGFFKALVQLEVEYCGTKRQKIHIRFKLDEKSELDPATLGYV